MVVIVVGLASLPVVEAHNALDAIARGKSDTLGADFGKVLRWLHCDDTWRAVDPPEPHVCPEYRDTPSGCNPCHLLFPTVVLTLDSTAFYSLDCHANLNAPRWAGTVYVNITGGPSLNCPAFEVNQGMSYNAYYAVHVHGSITTTGHYGMKTLTAHLKLPGADTNDVEWKYHYFNLALPPPNLASLEDDNEADIHHSVSEDLKAWNVTDPNSDDRLYQSGLDITPPANGSVLLETGVTARRTDNGTATIWHFESSLLSKKLMVTLDNTTRPGFYVWKVYPIVLEE